MLKTALLSQISTENKVFTNGNVRSLVHDKITPSARYKFCRQIGDQTRHTFNFTDGSHQLPEVNRVYCMEHIQHNTDLFLPSSPTPGDWVVLYYEQTTSALTVSFDNPTPIKIRSNQRIMGLDEPLVCDMPFMSLRFTFLDQIAGWALT